jgi:hypothetical protein
VRTKRASSAIARRIERGAGSPTLGVRAGRVAGRRSFAGQASLRQQRRIPGVVEEEPDGLLSFDRPRAA